MKVIPPVEITDALLVSSTAAEPDAVRDGAAAWSAATTYAVGDKVVRTGTHRIYQSGIASNLNKIPENNLGGTPPAWVDIGSTNRWKMLRPDANHQTSGASPLVVRLKTGQRITSVGVFNVHADTVLVEQFDSLGALVYTYTENLRLRETLTWSEYFFGTFAYQTSLLLLDLLPITGGEIQVTLTIASGDVRCGPVVYGMPVDLGSVELGATAGVEDFSTFDRNFAGGANLLPRKAVPTTQQTCLLPKTSVSKVRVTLLSLRAKVAMWVGVEDDAEAYFDSLAVLGIVQQWKLSFDEVEFAYLSLELEGF